MVDIAILVAEEYERRVKSSRKVGEASTDLAFCVLVWTQTLQTKIGQEKMEYLVKWVKEEPRCQISLEASNGFFSA